MELLVCLIRAVPGFAVHTAGIAAVTLVCRGLSRCGCLVFKILKEFVRNGCP